VGVVWVVREVENRWVRCERRGERRTKAEGGRVECMTRLYGLYLGSFGAAIRPACGFRSTAR